MNSIVLLLMIMVATVVLSCFKFVPGMENMNKITALTNQFVFIVVAIKYIAMGLYYMVTKRWPTSPPS